MSSITARLTGCFLLGGLLGPPAQATEYHWDGGLFSKSGVPNPLAPPDTAVMHDPSEAALFDVDFLNKSTFSYRHDNLVFATGVVVTNDEGATWVSEDDHGLLRYGGADPKPQFRNNGTFRKTGGGPTLIVNVDFRNRGRIEAQSGTIALNSPTKTFFDGTVLEGIGDGKIEIRNGGTFNNTFTATNTELIHGTYQGNAAQLARVSTVDWTSGVFTGNWTNRGTIVAYATGGTRQWGQDVFFTNDGRFVWQFGEMSLGGNAQVVNSATYELQATAGTAFNWVSGTVRPTFTNHGKFGADHGDRDYQVYVGDVHFVNHGTIDVPDTLYNEFPNTILFNGPATFEPGTVFAGEGRVWIGHDATFKGAFVNSDALELYSGRFTGVDAKMSGKVRWHGGTLADTWANDGTLSVEPWHETKRIHGVFINNLEVELLGSVAIVLGRSGESTTFENYGTFRVPIEGEDGGDRITREQGTDAKFVNRGTFLHSDTDDVQVEVPFENLATIVVERGTLVFTDTLTQRGVIRGSLEAKLTVPDGTVNYGRIRGFRSVNVTGRIINRGGGRIEPGESPGELLIEGNYVHDVGGVLEVEVQDAANYDRLLIDGSAELAGGDLVLSCYAGCDLRAGDRLDILQTTGGLVGTFGRVTLNGFGIADRASALPIVRVVYDHDEGRVSLEVVARP